MNIALCDNNEFSIKDLIHILDEISFKLDIDFYVDTFSCGEDLIEHINKFNKSYDLIFLDILMKKLNGIETARELRKNNKNIQIVFLTSTTEFALKGYDVHALNYLIKPVCFEKIESIILELESSDNYYIFSFKVNQKFYKVDLNDVNYFEINNRIVHINTIKNSTLTNLNIYEKLDHLESELSKFNFIRCHRSYLINLKNLQSVSSTEAIFTNNKIVPISRKYHKEVKSKFSSYFNNLVL